MTDQKLSTPPHSLEAEMSVLGSMLLESGSAVSKARDLLARADFYRDAHAHLFDAMLGLDGRGEPVDIVTLKDELQRRGILEGVGGVAYLMQLGDIQFTTANIEHYARIVQETAIRRRLIETSERIRREAYNPDGGNGFDQLTQAEKDIFDCDKGRSAASAKWRSAAQVFPDVWADIDEKHRAGGGLVGVSTGLAQVDALTNGLRPGALIILAGRTSMGKTACGARMAAAPVKEGKAVGVFSCEMGDKGFLMRVWAAEAQVNFRKVETGRWSDEEGARLLAAQDRLYDKPLFIEDSSQISITALASRARRLHATNPLSLIVVDYLQYLDGVEGKRYPSEREKIIDIAKGLKQLARDLAVPILALAQVNRGVEHRTDKRPLLSDLAESGRIEAESDIVAFLYRPSYYAPAESGANTATLSNDNGSGFEPIGGPREEVEFIVAKNRNGPTGFVKLSFAPKCMRFDNLSAYDESIF